MESTKYYSSKQEHMIARYLGWDVVFGSGARDCHPGDITSDNWLGECKTHTSPGKRITFNRFVWNKIIDEAQSKFKFPVLFVDDGSQSIEKTWCLFPYTLMCKSGYLVVSEANVDAPKSNIVIDHSKLLKCYKQHQEQQNEHIIIMSGHLSGTEIGVVPLEIFNTMFGDNE